MSGQDQTKGFLQGGCRELFMFGVNPDPQAVVSKVWEIYLDQESKKTQLYADAHVKVICAPPRRHVFELKRISQCKGVKERFFNLERRFACYRRYLPELDESAEEKQLREDIEWLRLHTGEPISRCFHDCLFILRQNISATRTAIRRKRAPALARNAQTLIDSGVSSNVP
jgi:hypothetical protein